jgi:hypothetical protein
VEERRQQEVVKQQQAADAAAAAAVHEAQVRGEYTALRVELRIAEVVPDRHMMLPAMVKKIEDMKREREQRQQLRLQQHAAYEQLGQQQQQAAQAAAELEAQRPKPRRQVRCLLSISPPPVLPDLCRLCRSRQLQSTGLLTALLRTCNPAAAA